MRAPRIHELPAPPEGLHGWPWDEAPEPLPDCAPDGNAWPAISLITPSYNQGQYIEETIRSILLQGYPNLEYFIIDGGSTDATVDIIRKYESWLDGWVSERDKGQSDAINKGFAKCSGRIFNWICSDDLLTPGALGTVAREFLNGDCDVLAGACFCQYDDEPEKSELRPAGAGNWEETPYISGIWQPSCYFSRSMLEREELLLRDLHYCMDRELWCYFFKRSARWKWSEKSLSHYRFTGANKSVTGREKIIAEIARIFSDHEKSSAALPGLLMRFWLPPVLARERATSSLAKACLKGASRVVSLVLLAVYPRKHVRALQQEFYVYSVW